MPPIVCQKGKKVKLRAEVCKGKEVLVHDLTELAQPGPKGDQGDPGEPGAPGSARAYAEVDAETPSLVAARSRGFASVERTGAGIYWYPQPAGCGVTFSTQHQPRGSGESHRRPGVHRTIITVLAIDS